ncbi:hypothetical protein GYMLUDRAFT_43600 [Collybiopsis luxurians FD-317 M1]|uniref:Cytochrome P450 n=1 Tax=Collybiopsis luxurians FD-317 M1 TaxID=944289 RepID=A0A0D0CW43_9AGAR|nr:hypothetical protein GYMLUDRAFT_43600 [Collybiopsis luxurians FD-317 M1]
MPAPTELKVIDLVCFGIFIFSAHRIWVHFETRRRRLFQLPPGPKGWPIIGNLYDFPKEKSHVVYMEMGARYQTDLIYLNVAGMSLLVVNSEEAANDLFVARFRQYSDRPQFTMASELVGWNFAFSTFPYGKKWRDYRALLEQELAPTNLQCYQKPLTQECVNVFLHRFLDDPANFDDHVNLLFGSIVLASAYGISVNGPHNRYLELAKEALRGAAEVAIPGTYIVDVFPFLKYLPGWFPGMSFQKKAEYERQFVEGMVKDPIKFVKNEMKNGTAKSSMASRRLQKMQDEGSWSESKEEILQNALGLLFAAQSDTTATATKTFILALVGNPEILKKGQAAVDAVIGLDRLPNFNDEGKIPYVDALVMEILRWRPVSPLGVAHYTSTADIYRGYYIPANTIVIGNSWAMLNDPNTYGKDVELFCPERFLELNSDGSETLSRSVPYPDAAFGFGRRMCPGRKVAHSALWITVASLLACFDISKVTNENGTEVDPDTEYIDGFLTYPRPFHCVIRPRSKAVEGMIRQSLEGQA